MIRLASVPIFCSSGMLHCYSDLELLFLGNYPIPKDFNDFIRYFQLKAREFLHFLHVIALANNDIMLNQTFVLHSSYSIVVTIYAWRALTIQNRMAASEGYSLRKQ